MKVYALLVIKTGSRGRPSLHGVYETEAAALEEQVHADKTMGMFGTWKWWVEEHELGYRPSVPWQEGLEELRAARETERAEALRKLREGLTEIARRWPTSRA